MNEFIRTLMGIFSAQASRIEQAPHQPTVYTIPRLLSHHEDIKISHDDASLSMVAKHAPFRRTGNTTLHEPSSVSDFITRFADAGSVMFVDAEKPSLEVVINYHHAGTESYAIEADATGTSGRDHKARPCDHTASYAFPISDEFLRWITVGKSGLTQEGLGDFVDQSINDFFAPTPALTSMDKSLLSDQKWEQDLFNLGKRLGARFGGYGDLRQLALSFEVDETSSLKVSRNPQTGEASFQMQNAHNTPTGEAIRLPGLFIIAIPIFRGGPSYRAPVRFAYRKSGQKVVFFLEVFNIEEVKRNAVNATVQEIVEGAKDEATGASIPVIWGRRG